MAEKTQDVHVALVAAKWHEDLVSIAVESCRKELKRLGVPVETAVQTFHVPGSLELPLMAKKLAQTKRYDAIILFGLVVDGGIYRHEFVAQSVLDGIMQVMLETETPILSTVLTPIRFHEHEDHRDFFREHLAKKGIESANAAIETINAHREIAPIKNK